jgi:hypothetical protein
MDGSVLCKDEEKIRLRCRITVAEIFHRDVPAG